MIKHVKLPKAYSLAAVCLILVIPVQVSNGDYQNYLQSSLPIYDFGFDDVNWKFHTSDSNEACQKIFSLTNEGLLIFDRYIESVTCDSRNLGVIATNHFLRANVVFLIEFTLDHENLPKIKNILVTIDTKLSEICRPNSNSVLYKSLRSFLPLSMHSLLVESQSYLKSLLSNLKETDGSVEAFHLSPQLRISINCHERHKRQLFSNLHSPVFSESSYTVDLNEEVSIGTQVIQVTATDSDEGGAGTIRYSLHADIDQRSLDIFEINAENGWVTTTGRVNRETISIHQFTIRARDLGSPSNSAQAALTININDINDHAPVFENNFYNISVSETSPVDYTVARLRASDQDTGSNELIQYTILNKDTVTDFSINPSSGVIKIVKTLNRETKSFYSFVVEAQDQALPVSDRRNTTVQVEIHVLDYNDNPPIFDKPNYSFTVKENVNISQGPAVIGEVSATDADEGVNGIISFAITFGNPVSGDPVFDIVPDTGKLRVITALDRDKTGGEEYNLRIQARDHGIRSLSSHVNVKVIVEDVNDNPPKFRYSTYEYPVYEDHTKGEPIATLTASDADKGRNQQLSYSILPTKSYEDFPIMINGQTGQITNNASLDRETMPRYRFMVQVEDKGDPVQFTTTNVTINILDINDNIPEFSKMIYTAVISEDTSVDDEVAMVTATDADENDVLTYKIVNGDDNNDFKIVKEQTFGVLRVNKELSYDRQKFYNMSVKAVDTSGKSARCRVLVTINDKNRHVPAFTHQMYVFNVSEDTKKGVTVGNVKAIDEDLELNGMVTYFFINNGVSLPFTINTTTGDVIVNDTLDRDNPQTQEFYIDVMARDKGLPPLQTPTPAQIKITLLDINDNPPVFSKTEYQTSVMENKTVDSSILTVSATDADQPGTPNSQIFYTFEGGNDGGGSFYMEHSGGTIRIRRPLDRESVSYYDLVVVARDKALSNRLSSSVHVKVRVLDFNDNRPQFESPVIIRRIYENKPEGTPVDPPIRATDADEGKNAEIKFKLVGGDTYAFRLQDRTDGSFRLYSKVLLDYESLRKNYSLEVQASSAHMITKATVIVKLQDVNDNSPELKNFTIIVNNYDKHFPDGYIGRVPAFDPDETDRASLRYTVKSGNEANFFFLNSTNGMIRLNKALDSDRTTKGQFVIQVSDVLNKINATCSLVYRLITAEMLSKSVTLRLANIPSRSFMVNIYGYLEQALARVLGTLPAKIYIIDIKEAQQSTLNVSFAALQPIDGKDSYLDQDYIKEQIYRELDLLKNLSTVTLLPFDDTLCVIEPCSRYKQCSTSLKFSDAGSFISSEAMLFRPIETKMEYKCSCPHGFGGLETYSCDIEINLCYSNPCLNSGVCKQIEGGYTCICPDGFKGSRCEHNFLKGSFNRTSCPSDVCASGSKCKSLDNGGFSCQRGSSKCEETDTHTGTCHLKSATFTITSYLLFPALKTRFRFNIQVSFATRKKSGLLYYNGRYNYEHDFIALELVNHTARFSMSLGDDTYSVSVGKKYGLNDGQWHTINVEYKNWTLIISLDQCDVGLHLAHPELFEYPCASKLDFGITSSCMKPVTNTRCSLDLTGPFLMGGLPGYLQIKSLSSDYFIGCMSNLYINYKLIDLNSSITNHRVQEGCLHKRDFCAISPCKNKGICTAAWSEYRCLCKEGRGSKDCSVKTGPTSTLQGISYMKYTISSQMIRKPWYNSFLFKTTTDNKLLMRINLKNELFIEYKLKSGYITFNYANFTYVFDEAFVNNDEWNHFEMRLLSDSKGQGQILLSLNYGEIKRAEPLDNSLIGIQIDSVYIGGDESTNTDNNGFYGCVKDIKVSSDEAYLTTPSKKQHVIDNRCSKPELCNQDCRGSRTCYIGWEESSCVCNEGLVGSDCGSVCSSSYNPCLHGGKCQVDREAPHGYRCQCRSNYTGDYCQDKVLDQCPSSWWGSPVCGPCNCSVELNFDKQCDRKTGECVCQTGYYKPPRSKRCVPCDCYFNAGEGGASSTSCDSKTGQCQCRAGVDGLKCDECENPFAEVTTSGCIVQYDSCPKKYTAGLWWSRTKFSVVRIESCPPGSVGNATRVCKDNQEGWLEPNLDGCTSLVFLDLTDRLRDLEVRKGDNHSQPVHGVDSSSYLYIATDLISSLRNVTETAGVKYSNDLIISIKILEEVLLREKAGKSFDLTNTRDKYFMENLIHITGHVLRADLYKQWKTVLTKYKNSFLTDLIEDFDLYIGNLADNMATKFVTGGMSPFQIVSDYMILGMDTIRENNVTIPKYNNIKRNDDMFDKITSVQLPSDLFEENVINRLRNKAVSGYILYKSLGELINSTYELKAFTDSISKPRYGSLIINSAVFSLVLQQGATKPTLNNPLEITFAYTNSQFTSNPQCVYLNKQGLWTSDGCSVKKKQPDRVVCSCNHLSTYAVVTDVYLNEIDLASKVQTHMYVTVGVSLVLFLFTLMVFICLQDLRSNYIYNQINVQLCFSLSLLIFVVGSDRWENQAGCTVVAVLLQFFTLSLFAWIFVNSLHLYRSLTEKRNIDREPMFLYITLGYIIPGIVTGLSVGLSPDAFGTEYLCWLSIDNTMIWSLGGPVLFCCIADIVLLILSVVHSCQAEAITTLHKNQSKIFKSAVWISIGLLPLTVCTWTFALLSINTPASEHHTYGYMFSVFTACTAVYTICVHVIFNKRGRNEISRRWKQCQGHGPFEGDSDASDKQIPFGEYTNNSSLGGGLTQMTLAGGSESSTTSCSRATGGNSDLLAYLKNAASSTSSDVVGVSYQRRSRRRTQSDRSSDSDTDSDIRTEREKDIELASSHSSDDDDPIAAVTTQSIKPVINMKVTRPPKPLSPLTIDQSPNSQVHSTPMISQEMGFAPPPPYFKTPTNRQWPGGTLSDSTVSSRGSPSALDTVSVQSSHKNQPPDRPLTLATFKGLINQSPEKINPASPYLNEHINPGFINSPVTQDRVTMSAQYTSPTRSEKSDNSNRIASNPLISPSVTRSSLESKVMVLPKKLSPLNHHMAAPDAANQDVISLKDSDSIITTDQSSNADDVFMPPLEPIVQDENSSPTATSAVNTVILKSARDLDLFKDLDDETQV